MRFKQIFATEQIINIFICECSLSDTNDGNVSRARKRVILTGELVSSEENVIEWYCACLVRFYFLILLFKFLLQNNNKEWRNINVVLKPFSLRRRLLVDHEFGFQFGRAGRKPVVRKLQSGRLVSDVISHICF